MTVTPLGMVMSPAKVPAGAGGARGPGAVCWGSDWSSRWGVAVGGAGTAPAARPAVAAVADRAGGAAAPAFAAQPVGRR